MYDHTFYKLANAQIRHKATHRVGCQPGDSIWLLQSSSWVCVGIYGLTYSLYHPRGGLVVKGKPHSMLGIKSIGGNQTADLLM